MAKNKGFLELIRKQSSMSASISRTDKDFGKYAGGTFEISSQLASIDTLLKHKLIPVEYIPIILFIRDYLNLQRKAWFSTGGSTEVTKLGFIQGDIRKVVEALEYANE